MKRNSVVRISESHYVFNWGMNSWTFKNDQKNGSHLSDYLKRNIKFAGSKLSVYEAYAAIIGDPTVTYKILKLFKTCKILHKLHTRAKLKANWLDGIFLSFLSIFIHSFLMDFV
jgi:hypothetical protein